MTARPCWWTAVAWAAQALGAAADARAAGCALNSCATRSSCSMRSGASCKGLKPPGPAAHLRSTASTRHGGANRGIDLTVNTYTSKERSSSSVA